MDFLSENDPFVSVQKEVQANWDEVSNEFETWKLQRVSHSALNPLTREEIENKLHTIEWDIQDLQEAVRIAKNDPAKFKLSAAQVAAREHFVAEMNINIGRLQEEIHGDVAGSDEVKKELLAGRTETERQKETREANDNFIDNEMQQQERIIQQQDEDLDHLATAVERIGLMGHDMHQELAEQGQLLDGLADDMDETRSRMAAVRQKLDRFIEETGPRQFCTIVGLCITFLVLTVLVATT